MNHARIASLAAIVIAGASQIAAAGERDAAHYMGTIDKKLPISMYLEYGSNGQSNGQYFYLKYGSPLFLTCVHDHGGHQIRETNRFVKHTGDIYFAGNSDGTITGTWTSPDKKRTLPLELTEIGNTLTLTAAKSGVYSVSTGYLKLSGDSPFAAALNKELAQRAEKVHAKFEKEFRELAEADHKNAGVSAAYERIEFPVVMHASDSLVSLRMTISEYTGGAHSNYAYQVLNFQWQDGKLRELQPGDLISLDAMKLLREKVVNQLKIQEAASPEDAIMDAKNPPRLNFTSEGILLTFAPYEVGPFSQGTQVVALPWKSLEGILSEKSVLRGLVK
jgi:hypothetical protein